MLPFRVGLDVWPALRHPPGIGRWVRELVRALVQLDERPELRLYDVGPGRVVLAESSWNVDGRAGVRRIRASVPRRWVDLAGRAGFGAERWLGGVELFQRTFPSTPRLGRVPEIVPVFELPERGSAAERELRNSLARAGHALVASAWSASQVRERFELAGERVHCVPIGCDHWTRDFDREREHPAAHARARIVVLGALAARREPLTILAAVEALVGAGRDLELVFCGRRGDADAEFERARAASSLGARVVRIDTPIERDLPELVGRAAVLVHLNHEECTAVTPLEAASLGVGVVATRLEPFVEALGEHASWVEPRTGPRELARALEVELDRSLDAAARAARRELAAPFTWERHARATVAVWRSVLGR